MDASTNKFFEVQAKVRHNADDLKNTLNDLYKWEKSMKEKEHVTTHQPPPPVDEMDHLKTLPVRSNVTGKGTTPTTKVETKKQNAKPENKTKPVKDSNPLEEKRTQANEYKDRGNNHVKLGEYNLAINEYNAAIALYAEDPIFFMNRALCYLKMEKYEECIEDCERAIILDSMAVKAYYRRMQANESLGNNMDALKDCTAVLMIDPKNTEAKKSLERINDRLRKNAKTCDGPNFSPPRSDFIDILPIDKPPYKRSNAPLMRVPIADVVGPKDNKNYQNSQLQISDEELDKLFNSNCGSYVEVKKEDKNETKPTTASNKKVMTADPANDSKITKPINVDTKKSNVESSSKTPEKQEPAPINKEKPALATPTKPAITKKSSPNSEAMAKQQNASPPRPLPPAPTSVAQFYANWKELTDEQKYQYLKSINLSNLEKILGAGFDSDTLTDVLFILRDFYMQQKDVALPATLLAISKNSQVSILSLLMSTEERNALTDILNSLKKNEANASVVKQISQNFNLN